MTAVRFDRRGYEYAVTFAYNADLVDVLKLTVPAYARRWSPPRREWLIEAMYGKPLANELRRLGCTIIGLDPDPVDASDWARSLFRAVGPTRCTVVYRALSRVLHPDTATGDKRLQQELNDAHAALTQPTTGRRAS